MQIRSETQPLKSHKAFCHSEAAATAEITKFQEVASSPAKSVIPRRAAKQLRAVGHMEGSSKLSKAAVFVTEKPGKYGARMDRTSKDVEIKSQKRELEIILATDVLPLVQMEGSVLYTRHHHHQLSMLFMHPQRWSNCTIHEILQSWVNWEKKNENHIGP